MNIGKKLIAIALGVQLILQLLPAGFAFGAENSSFIGNSVISETSEKSVPSVESDFKFDASTGTITGYTGASGDVVIPDAINGVKVTSIGDSAFEKNNKILSIKIPNGVTTIGRSAFLECKALESVVLPESLKNINDSAFSACYGLVSIDIPTGVKVIDKYAFSHCISLENINIPYGIEKIEDNTFCWCKNLEKIVIPDETTAIGNYAFGFCDKLVNINLPKNVTSIGEHAFRDCKKLKSLELPNKVDSISQFAFYGCSNLEGITIPSNVKVISNDAFNLCSKLRDIVIENGVTKIDYNAFSSCGIVEVSIPDSVSSIGECAFGYCSKLKSIKFSKNMSKIEYTSLWECESLESITIPKNINYFDNCLGDCKSLKSAYFEGDAPEGINENTFAKAADNFIIYYRSTSKGFTTPTWFGYKTQMINETPSPTTAPAKILFGDVTGDETTDSADYTLFRKYLLQKIDKFPIANGLKAADLNADGVVDSADYTLLRKYLLKMIKTFPGDTNKNGIVDTDEIIDGLICISTPSGTPMPKTPFDYAIFTEDDLNVSVKEFDVDGDARTNSDVSILSTDFSVNTYKDGNGNVLGGKLEYVGQINDLTNLKKIHKEIKVVDKVNIDMNLSTKYLTDRDKFNVIQIDLENSTVNDKKIDDVGGALRILGHDLNIKKTGENIWTIRQSGSEDIDIKLSEALGVNNKINVLYFKQSIKISTAGNITGKGIIISNGDILIDGTRLDGELLLYSLKDNIKIINSSSFGKAVLYAPYGNIDIGGMDYKLEGAIIGKRLNVTTAVLNIEYKLFDFLK